MPAKKHIKYLFIDFLIYILAFAGMLFLKYGKIDVTENHSLFLYLYIFSWLLSTVATSKIKALAKKEFISAARPFIISFIITSGLLAVFSHLYDLEDFSRYVIAGSLLIAISLELFLLWIKTPINFFFRSEIRLVHSRKIFLFDLLILSWVLFFFILNEVSVSDNNENLSVVFASPFLSWFLSAILTHRFRMNFTENYIKVIWQYVKSYIVTLLMTGSILFMLRISEQLRLLTFEALILYSVWSFGILTYYYFSKIPKRTDETRLKLLKTTEVSDELIDPEKVSYEGIYSFHTQSKVDLSIRESLKNDYLKRFPEVFKAIDSSVNLNTFTENNSVILRSADPYNIEIIREDSIELFLNLHEFNDIRRINAYFIEINKRLKSGGVYIGNFEPVKYRHNRFLKKYPFFIAKTLYFVDFLWKRVTPKIPVIQKFYFGLTKGKDRAISFAEGMGRLYYSGFDIIKIFEHDFKIFFIAVKIKEPSTDENPSYGPIFKMKRIGKNGNIIYVYKLRTMHPYAEYLQEFVYKISNLAEGGKFKDDFRITSWGKVFRKLWIDELPMLINLFNGDLKLVGVRPLSKHYFNLYDEQLKKLRVETKPGLVPPYYADMPKTLEEIMKSEKKYLMSYAKSPVLTDIKYFFKSFYNIIIKKARSG